MRKLPSYCATTNLDGDPIIIKKGETGYSPMTGASDDDIAEFNKQAGADEEAIAIMIAASMFGWDVPAVTKYEES